MNRTVLRTVEILEVISKHDEISLADLVKITGYPKTSAYDALYALGERIMIYRCTDKVCYDTGFRTYAIGHSYSKNSDLSSNSYQCMKALAEDIGKAMLLGKIGGEKILYIIKCESKHPVVITPSIGDEEPIKSTTFAKTAEMFTHHEKKICQPSKEEKNRIRTEKLASYELDDPGPFYNIANLVYNFETRPLGMINMFGVKEVEVDYSGELKKARECAGKISERLEFIQSRNSRYKKGGTERGIISVTLCSVPSF